MFKKENFRTGGVLCHICFVMKSWLSIFTGNWLPRLGAIIVGVLSIWSSLLITDYDDNNDFIIVLTRQLIIQYTIYSIAKNKMLKGFSVTFVLACDLTTDLS